MEKNRKDPISKTIPTKLYNAVTRWVSGIKLHDMNCGLKAYKNQVVKNIEVYGEMHRYIPLIAKWAGFQNITEKVVHHQARKFGVTKFGLERFIFGFLDLFSITFIGKYGKRPMHLFGTLGTVVFIIGFVFLFYIGIDKIFFNKTGKLIANRTEFYIALTSIIIGVQFLAGFLGEMLSRNSPNRNYYQIKEKSTLMNKIIIVGPASPLRGGISDFNEALAKSLGSKNKDVEIVSFSLQYPSIFFPGKTQNKTTNENDLNFKISPIINSINPLSWRKAAKHIALSKPDKVFIRFWMPFFAPCLGFIGSFLKKKKINVSGIVDNAVAHEKRWGDKQLVNFFLKSCNNHITLSKKVKQDILSINKTTTVKALFHPIYDTYKPLIDKNSALNKLNLKEGKYILFFGLIRKYKGLDLAIKAMAEKQIIKNEN